MITYNMLTFDLLPSLNQHRPISANVFLNNSMELHKNLLFFSESPGDFWKLSDAILPKAVAQPDSEFPLNALMGILVN